MPTNSTFGNMLKRRISKLAKMAVEKQKSREGVSKRRKERKGVFSPLRVEESRAARRRRTGVKTREERLNELRKRR